MHGFARQRTLGLFVSGSLLLFVACDGSRADPVEAGETTTAEPDVERGSETDPALDAGSNREREPDEASDVAVPGDSSSSERLTRRPAGTVEGAPLGYLEYLPAQTQADDPPPLLVSFHGSGEAGPGTEGSLNRLLVHGVPALIEDDRWPDDRPFIVLMPQYGPELSRSCDLSVQIADFLAFAVEHYEVDEDRVYVTGVSCSASGTWGYLADHGDEVVAAAVLIAGRAVTAVNDAGCELGRTPLWVFHGAEDDMVSTAGVVPAVEQLQGCTDPPPVDVRLTVYPDVGHESWDRTYDLSAGHDVYAWLLEHTASATNRHDR